jgi:hypothetical protein
LETKARSFLIALLATLLLFHVGGSTTALAINRQTIPDEIVDGSLSLDVNDTMHIVQITENAHVGETGAGEDTKNRFRQAQGTAPLLHSNDIPSDTMASDQERILPANEKTFSDQGKKMGSNLSPDWKGAGRDTVYLIGYQVVVAGALYLLPESVTNWTDEQKRATVNKWADNVQSATWDTDEPWLNYLAHPYWGATYYIRARERGFGEFGSFLYSAFLSALYEYGIEAFFEQPSYQDLIVTPVGGILVGKFVFEPIRASIKSKTELAWYDNLLLVLTDPLGAANRFVDRSLGIKSETRLTSLLTMPLRLDGFLYNPNSSLAGRDKNRSNRKRIGIGFDLTW